MNNGYAEAFFKITLEQNSTKECFESFKEFYNTLKISHELKQFLSSVNIDGEEKKQFIKDNFSFFNKDLIYFLYVLIDNNIICEIEDIYVDFKEIYYDEFHIKEVILVSSEKMEEKELNRIHALMDKKYPNEMVVIENIINKDIIGGYSLFVDGKEVSITIDDQINQMKKNLK